MGSIIALDCHPTHDVILVGTMDERHAVLAVREISETELYVEVQQQWHSHEKYVVRTKWSPDGTMFAAGLYFAAIFLKSRFSRSYGGRLPV